ncbi:glycerophosphodiester phosphodiesterase family protein [Oryzifoliimicrobium ureilyticus]|uniref:glycerophosphodiester phosphodiesterase family protein n=1 Tax=Oryzifoliimicrobium ureilyticus TaxID=3113724 RepID=UPI0030760B58
MSISSVSLKASTEFSCDTLLSRRNPDILAVAHRGLWTSAPENSLLAIRVAMEAGVEIVEIDVQTTADGELVIIHDGTLDRTTTGSGTVSKTSLETIRAERLRAAAGGREAALTDERVPTLKEALEEARGRLLVNLDTKYDRDLDDVVKAVLDLGMQDHVIIKSKIEPATGNFPIAQAPWFGKVIFMPIFTVRTGMFSEDLKAIEVLSPKMIEISFSDLSDLQGAEDELERQDIRLWINTLDVAHSLDLNDTAALKDGENVWGRLIDAGAGAIQTDEAAAFKAFVAHRG